jgi:uncharacterized protein YPO0396
MASEDNTLFTERCRRITEKIDRSTQLHPREIEKEIDEIERELVRLRDELIVRSRQAEADATGAQARTKLDHVNVALSLVVAVEYPVTSIQRSALQQANQILKNC